MCCDKFREDYCSTFEFKKKSKKNFAINVSMFRSRFIINFGKVRGSRLYRRFPFLIFNNSKGFQMMYCQLMLMLTIGKKQGKTNEYIK